MAAARDGYLAVFTSARSDAGRAMALANIAALLAQRGDRVLVIDLAVDSPTLARYFPDAKRRQTTASASGTGRARLASGVVDLLALVREGARRLPAARNAPRAAAGSGPIRELVEKVLEASDAAIRRVNLRYPGLPEERTVELHFMPVGGDDAPHERAHPFEGLDLFPGVLEEIANSLRSRYDAVLIDAPTGEGDTTAILASHLADKLVFLVDDASLEEAIELASWAQGRRSLASTDRALNLFPLLAHVPDGAAGKAFVDEARPRLEALFGSILGTSSCDLSLYVELAQIPNRALRAQSTRLAVEIEPTSNPQGASHAYFRFVQCLSKTSPIRVGARARPMSADLMSAIEARRTPAQAAEPAVTRPVATPPTPARNATFREEPPQQRPSRIESPPAPTKLAPKHSERLQEAMTLRAHGRNAEAAKICAAIVREAVRDERGSKETAKALLALGDLSAQTETGEYDEIVHRFHERRLDDPEMFECVIQAHYRRGKRHAARERFALATDSLMAVVEIAREWKFPSQPSIDLRALAADAALSLAIISMERGDDARALHALGRAIEAPSGGGSVEQRAIEAAASCLEIMVLARAGRPDHAAAKGAALRERLGASPASPFDAIAAIAACNEGAALGLAGRYDEALVLLGALRERLEGAWESPYYEVALAAAHNEAAVLGRAGRLGEALERINVAIASASGLGGSAHRLRFASSLVEGSILGALGRHDDALAALEKLQTTLRWEEVCLDHPGDVYMRERRTDVAWYLTIARDRARGVDELPSLLQAAEEEGDARHGRVHLRAAFELARHGRRLDDLGAHPAAAACHDDAMMRLERAATRPPGDAAMLACAGLVAISRGATPRGIPLLRKAAEQGGTAAIQWALEAVHGEGFDAESIVAAVREAFDWIPRERMDTLRAADPLGVSLIRALVFPGRPPEPLLPPPTYPPCAGRFAASTMPPLSGAEPGLTAGSTIATVARLLLLEPPDGTVNDVEAFSSKLASAGCARGAVPALAAMASWPQRMNGFAGNADEIASAVDGLLPRSSSIAAIVERRDGAKSRDVRFAVEIEAREGVSFRLAVLHDVHGHERLVFDGVTLTHYREGQEPAVVRRPTTMLLGLWRALAQGIGATFQLSVLPNTGSAQMVVLGGTAREPGTGVMRLELHIDRVLLARKDPGAVRQIVLEDVDGALHRFDIQATVGKIELSLFGGSQSG